MAKDVKILYVEDDPDIRDVVDMALEDEGFDLLTCESGLAALKAAPDSNPDLILLDVMMPGLNGPTTLKKLRDLPHLSDTPAIFMTAKVRSVEVEYYFTLGAIGVISKPFEPMGLADQIRSLLDKPNESL
jgi:two-component system, OmpR family, response regulator